MSETEGEQQHDPWMWQGFYGPAAVVSAAKTAHEALLGTVPPQVGIMVPLPGLPPDPVDEGNTDAMYAVRVPRDAPLPTPPGLKAAREERVARLVGA